MDVERYLLSSALSGIISQRLAKMLCPHCRYQRETTKYEKKVFKRFMNMDVTHVWDANPNGCDKCRKGYRGRIAIHEVLELTDEIRAAISNEKMEKKDIAKLVYDGKTITMLQDALIKCLEGKTSFEEVYRTIEIENEEDDNYEHEVANDIKNSIQKETTSTQNVDGAVAVQNSTANVATINAASSAVINPNAYNVSQVNQQPTVIAANNSQPQYFSGVPVISNAPIVTPNVNATSQANTSNAVMANQFQSIPQVNSINSTNPQIITTAGN